MSSPEFVAGEIWGLIGGYMLRKWTTPPSRGNKHTDWKERVLEIYPGAQGAYFWRTCEFFVFTTEGVVIARAFGSERVWKKAYKRLKKEGVVRVR
jgi:hypothetical protein